MYTIPMVSTYHHLKALFLGSPLGAHIPRGGDEEPLSAGVHLMGQPEDTSFQ